MLIKYVPIACGHLLNALELTSISPYARLEAQKKVQVSNLNNLLKGIRYLKKKEKKSVMSFMVLYKIF
jgi:hypothetical protein